MNDACAGPRRPSIDDLLDAGAEDGGDRRVRRVRRGELLLGEREHARDVDGDVAVADDDGPLARRGRTTRSWKSGWPLYQATNSVAAHEPGQVLARDAEPPVGLRADRVDDRVVEPRELVVLEVASDLDVAEEAEARARAAIFSKTRETALMFGWSGATPSRTSPQGVGSRSIMSTSTGTSAASR